MLCSSNYGIPFGICVSHLYATDLFYFTGAGSSGSGASRKGKKIKRTSHKKSKFYREQAGSEHEDIEIDEEETYYRLTSLNTVLGLSPSDYITMRNLISFDPPRTASVSVFWKKEQELIFREVYEQLENPVCPQKALEVARLQRKDHTKEAAMICEHLGLDSLIEQHCNYNIKLVQQFFATLVIGAGPNIPLTWMTNNQVCRSDFVRFSQLLGYPFIAVNEPAGARMHSEHDVYDKEEMAPLYINDTYLPGKSRGLSRLYNTLLRIFRNNIAPEIGNLDDIRGGLINLLVYARRIKRAMDEGEDLDELETVDVMDFIFREIKHCIQGRHVPVYAPYVMMLLIDVAHVSPTDGCEKHIVSYI